jgi:hypothetical protein
MNNPDVPTFSFRIQQQTIQCVVQLHRGARCDDELQPLLSSTQRLLLLNQCNPLVLQHALTLI